MKQDVKHFLSLADLTSQEIVQLVDRTLHFQSSNRDHLQVLAGKSVGIYFPKPSTRTRTSFTIGAQKLGAHVVSYGPDDMQLTTGETIEDTAIVLSGFLDILVIRNNGSDEELKRFAGENLSIINALSAHEHPSQIIADLATLKTKFGSLEGLHLLYLGLGNNTAAGLALGFAQIKGMKITFATPKKHAMEPQIMEIARKLAAENGSSVEEVHNTNNLPKGVDAVYTTRWQSMGATYEDEHWMDEFIPFKITHELMQEVSKEDTIFMHDLPAEREMEVLSEILDAPNSWIRTQAANKMYSAMAIMEWCLK